jgi:hypothetical protein
MISRLIRNGQEHYYSNEYMLNSGRDGREAKRGGTAPGESRKAKQGPYDLAKVYAVNPRLQKMNFIQPNDSNLMGSNVLGLGVDSTKQRPKFS